MAYTIESAINDLERRAAQVDERHPRRAAELRRAAEYLRKAEEAGSASDTWEVLPGWTVGEYFDRA